MKIDILIGRDVEGASVLVVPGEFKKVSRRHAVLHWNDGIVTIEDNESANGTFVNGRRVAKTPVAEGDTILLGGNTPSDSYRVDVKKIFNLCRDAENKARTDYTEEYRQVRRAYMEYREEKANLKHKITVKSQLPMRLVSLIPGVLGLVLFFVLPDDKMGLRIGAISAGGVITALINTLLSCRNNSAADSMEDMMADLQIKYQPRYCCPKCGTKFPLTKTWKIIEEEGKCPNPKCNATFSL